MAKTEVNTERYNIQLRRVSDDALFVAEKVSFEWLLKFLRKNMYKDSKNIKEGSEIMGRKSFSDNNISKKIGYNK